MGFIDALVYGGGSIWTGREKEFVSFLDRSGADRAVLVADTPECESQPFAEANDAVAKLLAAHPARVAAFCRLQPRIISTALSELARRLEQGFRGFVLSPLTDRFFIEDILEFFAEASARRCPVILRTENHLVRQPRYWQGIFETYPNIPVILAGGGRDYYRQAAELAREFSQVYFETSDLALERARSAVRIAGDEKAWFASGYPASDPELERKKWEFIDPATADDRMGRSQKSLRRVLGIE